MRFNKLALVLFCDDVARSSDFYVSQLGFRVVAELDWYVSLHHDDHPAYVIDLVQRDHETVPETTRGRPTSGVSLALVVEDAAARESEMRANAIEIVTPIEDMPWGQRRFHLRSPEGVLVEIVQFTSPDPVWVAQQERGVSSE
jgi:catechol 2,3-dioxygenase-like lactoylglutathione lyase family enzyme